MEKIYIIWILIFISLIFNVSATTYTPSSYAGFCDTYSNGVCNITGSKSLGNDIARDFITININTSISSTGPFQILNVTNLMGVFNGGTILVTGTGNNLTINATNIYRTTMYTQTNTESGSAGAVIINADKIYTNATHNVHSIGGNGQCPIKGNGGAGGDIFINADVNIQDYQVYSIGGNGQHCGANEGTSGGSAGSITINSALSNGTLEIYTDGGNPTITGSGGCGTGGSGGDITVNITSIEGVFKVNSQAQNGAQADRGCNGGAGGDIYVYSNFINNITEFYTDAGSGGSIGQPGYDGGDGGVTGDIFIQGDGTSTMSSDVTIYSTAGRGGNSATGTPGNGGNAGFVNITGFTTLNLQDVKTEAGDKGTGTGGTVGSSDYIFMNPTTSLTANNIFTTGGTVAQASGIITLDSPTITINGANTTTSDIFIYATDLVCEDIVSENSGVSAGDITINATNSGQVNSIVSVGEGKTVNIYGGTMFLNYVKGADLNVDVAKITDNNTQDWVIGTVTFDAENLTLANNFTTTNTVNMTFNISENFFQDDDDAFIQWGNDLTFVAVTQQLGDMLFVSSTSSGGFVTTRFKWENNDSKFINFVYDGSFTVAVTDNSTASSSNNSAPSISSVAMSPVEPYSGAPVSCIYSATDSDGDTLTPTYDWFINGTIQGINSASLTDSNFNAGDTLKCQVSVSDGTVSTTQSSGSALVSATQSSGGGGGGSVVSTGTSSESTGINFINEDGNEVNLNDESVNEFLLTIEPIIIEGEEITTTTDSVSISPSGFVEIPIDVSPASNAHDADGDGLFTGPLDDYDGDGIPNILDRTLFGIDSRDAIENILPEGDDTILVLEDTIIEKAQITLQRPSYVCLVTATPTKCSAMIPIKFDKDVLDGKVVVEDDSGLDISFCDLDMNCIPKVTAQKDKVGYLFIQVDVPRSVGESFLTEREFINEIKIVEGLDQWSVPYILERGPLYPTIRKTSVSLNVAEKPVSLTLYTLIGIVFAVTFFGLLAVAL
jgi:hypothetical protein